MMIWRWSGPRAMMKPGTASSRRPLPSLAAIFQRVTAGLAPFYKAVRLTTRAEDANIAISRWTRTSPCALRQRTWAKQFFYINSMQLYNLRIHGLIHCYYWFRLCVDNSVDLACVARRNKHTNIFSCGLHASTNFILSEQISVYTVHES